MEVAVKELNAKGKESVLVADGKEDADECNHFTIRGYVAGVRKRDAKICWPLFMPNNESSDTHANMLPPLHVYKFKRWSCLNCIHTISTSADVTGNADFTNVQNKETKTNNSFLLNVNAKRLQSGSKQSDNPVLGERLMSDSSINVSHGEHSPVPYCGKKEHESATEDAAKEGIRVFLCGKFRSEENQDWSSKPASAMAEGENFQAGESQKRNMTVIANNSDTVLVCDDASPMVCAKPNGGESNGFSDGVLTFRGTNLAAFGNKNDEGTTAKGKMNVIADDMTKESRKLVGVDLGIPKDDALIATVANITNYDLTGLGQSNIEASYSNVDLSDSMNWSQNQNSVFSSSHGKVNHKKIRKLRLLEDIMKSEEIHISKKLCTSKGDAETFVIKNNHDRESNGSKCEAQPGDCISNLVSQNSKVTPAKHINGIEVNQNKDEELSLMHWLKKVSKKFVVDDSQKKKDAKGYAEIKHTQNKVGVSPGAHNEKDVDPLPKVSRVSKQNKQYTVEKENEMPPLKPSGHCLMPQEEDLISNDAMVKHVHHENVCPKMRNMLSAPGNLDRSFEQKAGSIRRKKKASQVEDRNSSHIKWTRMQKEVIKKRRSSKTREKETLDDIPMDIVELLAKNQHERRLMNAETSNKNKHELSMMTGEMRHGNNSYVSGYCGNKISNAICKSNATSNDTGYDIPTAPHGNRNTDYVTEVCKPIKYQKHILIDLNKQATDFLTIPEYDEHQPSSTHLPAVDSKITDSLQNSYWGRMSMQDLGSYQRDQGLSTQSSRGDTHDMLSAPLHGRIFGVNTRNSDTYCNHGKMVPYDSFLDRSQRIVVQKTDYQEPMNLPGSHVLNEGGKYEQSTNRTLPTRSYLTGGNRCHSGRAAQMDLHSNETMSALHLLRLVDQAALSGASWDINRIGIAEDSNVNFNNQSTEVLGVEVRSQIRENPENPFTARYFTHDQNEGNFSKPHRPVPRIGVLGSLLQKEIMTHSNKCMTPLGSKARCSDELPCFCIDGMEKTDASSSAINVKYGGGNTRSSLTTTTKQSVIARDSPVHKFEMGQVGSNKKDEPVQSVGRDPITVNCIINRNPADFSIPDEDNVYMRGSEDLGSKCMFSHRSPWYQTHHDGKKWQVVNLPVLKGS